jgi:dCTP deaminase
MVVNGKSLYALKPVDPMFDCKMRGHGVTHGLGEAGYDVRVAQDVVLHPFKRFTLASTVEKFTMPNTLVVIVHDKSSHIRRGLVVGNSVVEPSWEGFLTLELFYHGWGVLRLPAGTGIAQVIFHALTNIASYRGKYQNQPARPVPAIMEKG